MVKHLINFIVLSILISPCTGCAKKVHKDYGFTSPEHHIKNGVIRAKIRGTMADLNDDTSVNHAPYELLLWLTTDNPLNLENCAVELKSIVFKNLESGQRVDIPSAESASFRIRSDEAIVASIRYKNLNLDFADHHLSFALSYDGSCSLVPSQNLVSLEFNKNYREWQISFWDVLMGI